MSFEDRESLRTYGVPELRSRFGCAERFATSY